MYLSFYNLEREPFGITPDPAFLFLSDEHKEALASVTYGVDKRKGFIALTGEVGTGKTTLLRSFLASIDRDKTKPVYIFNANLTFEELLREILRELELDAVGLGVTQMVSRLHEYLIGEYQAGRNVAVFIDEAQNSPVETLENLRMLSNLESTGDKLIQIVLSGQPELNDKLDLHELRQLKQRIAVRSNVGPLTRRDSFDYVEHRLSVSSAGGGICFSQGALKRIVAESKGFPRTLNILCDNVLVAGYGYQIRPVNARIAQEAIADFRGKSADGGLTRRFALVAVMVLVVGMMATAYHYAPGRTEAGSARAELSGKEEPRASVESPTEPPTAAASQPAPVASRPEPAAVVVEAPVEAVEGGTPDSGPSWTDRASAVSGLNERLTNRGLAPLALLAVSPLQVHYAGPFAANPQRQEEPVADQEAETARQETEQIITADTVVVSPPPPEEHVRETVENAGNATPIQERPQDPTLWALPEI